VCRGFVARTPATAGAVGIFGGMSMLSSQLHYLPLPPTFFSILVGVFLLLVVLIQFGVLRYAYLRIGIGSGAALLLLL
jgi:hypothetical protein